MSDTKQNYNEKTWDEFRESGFFWFINNILHAFGWVIGCEVEEDGKVSRVFPARTRLRGFGKESNDRGYRRISDYLVKNAEDIKKEAYEED